jgi:hypothetical protein
MRLSGPFASLDRRLHTCRTIPSIVILDLSRFRLSIPRVLRSGVCFHRANATHTKYYKHLEATRMRRCLEAGGVNARQRHCYERPRQPCPAKIPRDRKT